MIIEADICLAEVFSQLDADDILHHASDEILDEVATKYIGYMWQSKITDSAINDFVDILVNHFDEVARECDSHQLKKIRDIVNGN